MAAFDLNGGEGRDQKPAGTKLTMAYVVRAVTPGTSVLPGTTVEDMYRPEAHARTEAGQVVVTGAEVE